MTELNNHAELKAELKAKTNELVSQDKELFANLSKEEITEKKKERAKEFREENRELIDRNKIMFLIKEYKELIKEKPFSPSISLYKEDPPTEDEIAGWYDSISFYFEDQKWNQHHTWGSLDQILENIDKYNENEEITEETLIDTIISKGKEGYILQGQLQKNKNIKELKLRLLPRRKVIKRPNQEGRVVSFIESELIEEAVEKIKPFVENLIKNGHLHFFGDHGHLGYYDVDFWGHYIRPTKKGVRVTVYLQNEIIGNPMDIEGERGSSFDIDILLDKELKELLLVQVKKDYEKAEKEFHTAKGSAIRSSIYELLGQLDDSIKILKE